MQRVLVNMQKYLLGEAVAQALKHAGDFHVTVVEHPKDVATKQFNLAATVVLMEVTGCTPCTLSERMLIRDEIKKREPNCKVVLLVDENAEQDLARQVKQLKRDGLIDQFIYGSISASYLAALMDTV